MRKKTIGLRQPKDQFFFLKHLAKMLKYYIDSNVLFLIL